MVMQNEVSVKETVNHWNLKGTEIMFKIMAEQSELTADDFAREARKQQMPPLIISKLSGGLIKSFKCQGYLKKTKIFKLSERNSNPLPVYTVVLRSGKA